MSPGPQTQIVLVVGDTYDSTTHREILEKALPEKLEADIEEQRPRRYWEPYFTPSRKRQ